MADTFFAFAPNQGYVYKTPKQFKWAGLEPKLDKFLDELKVQSFVWAAFGPERGNYFIAWLRLDGKLSFCTGKDTPKLLVEWLNEGYDEQIRVSLGPDGSFFAWTGTRIRWHNIPQGLQTAVQSWLSPAGWTKGPPRIVSLGTLGSYFALSEYGCVGWNIPRELTSTRAAIDELNRSDDAKTITFSQLEVMSLSSCDPDFFVYVTSDLKFSGNVPDPVESFHEIFETLYDDDTAKKAKEVRQRAAEAKKKAQAEAEARAKREKDEEERKARAKAEEERRLREREADEAEQLALQYWLWQTGWEDDMVRKKVLTTFPHLPIGVCVCKEVSCTSEKEEPGSLRACRHDVERFFRASGMYDYTWLKKQRLAWHPDRFGQRCDPDFRRELRRKAEKMYQIFEILMEQEKLSGDFVGSSP